MKTSFTTLCLVIALTAPAWTAEDFTGVKQVRLVHGDLGSPKAKTVVIKDKGKIDQLVATIKLEEKDPCACDHIDWAVFVKDKGEIKVSLCDHCFDIGQKTYKMPQAFYKLYTAHMKEGAGGEPVERAKPSDPEKVAPAEAASAQDALKDKKLLEWGWDEPDTKFMRENVQKMEQMPFDGLIFHVMSSNGGNSTWEMWGSRKFELAEFQHAIDDLKGTPFRRLTDRFLRVNVSPGTVDWFDDQGWAIVLQNFTVAAQVAKQGGCKGFMFDVEQYNDQLFSYGKQKHRENKTFADYQAKVRQRGQEWMKAVGGQFPDIIILLTFGYSITGGAARDRAGASYGLLADFLDGMLDACPAQTKIVDAWEGAYTYKKQDQFRKAYETIKVKSAEWTAVPEKYHRQVEAGFGIWMDCNWRGVGWHLDDLSKNHFTPAEFEASVRSALEVSDQYVWVYTEQPRWWTNEKLPKAYVEALRKAAARAKSSQPGDR